ncbi:hypothetical protein OIM93_03100 [Clostridium chauvoei]|uniref:TcaA 3rd/4th domain-containing protein n=1 Tax=Clostridium chauvoei TaxID=46867 RepID=UPI002079CE83|nr:hypothetical protein [Clostridium chauvoei]
MIKKISELGIKTKECLSSLKSDLYNLKRENLKETLLKRKMCIITILSMVIAIIFLFKSTITSENKLLKDLESSLKDVSSYRISRKIKISEETPNKKELMPLIKYYNYDQSKIEEVIKSLREKGKSGVFTLKKNKVLIFNSYYLELTPVSIKLNTNFNDAKLYLDGNLLRDTKIKRGLVPGIYSIKAELETDYGKITKEEEVSLMQNEEVDLKLDAMNITLTSNFNDAKVYINDKDTGKFVKDIKDFGPFKTNSDTYIFLEREFPWGTIKSEKFKIKDLPNINIDINMINDELITNIEDTTKTFYRSVFTALNSRDKSLIRLTDEDTRNRIYEDIEQKTLLLKNNYEISELETNIQSSEFKYEDNTYKANIVVKVNYNVYKQFFSISKKKNENMFLTTMKYVGNEWLIESVQKFTLE